MSDEKLFGAAMFVMAVLAVLVLCMLEYAG